MPIKIIFLTKILTIILLLMGNLFAFELSIIPLKKPILDKSLKAKKIINSIIKPKPKPRLEKDLIKEKPIKKKIAKKKKNINDILLPKNKPIIVKRENIKVQKTSKYFKQKDFNLAKKSIQEFEKGRWTNALKLSKKSKDKSIQNFIQWKHLLTTGNQASFYDYKLFIDRNENYPRINRIRYLAEHKLSTNRISPKKIINWFGTNEPLSGFGKLILGESLIATGNIDKGKNFIKEGWITADLNRSNMKFFRKKIQKIFRFY